MGKGLLKKKLTTCEADEGAELGLGREVYNRNCYYCHGYNGDARTAAADYLSPPPRDLTKASTLEIETIIEAVTDGRPGTAMAAFGARLSVQEIEAVAAFITREFLLCQSADGRYHSPENGWSAEDPENLAAAPFVTGKIPYDQSPDRLTAEMRKGQAIFLESCITCHRGRHYDAEEAEEEGELPAFAALSSLQSNQVLDPVSAPAGNEQKNNVNKEKQHTSKNEHEHFSEIYDRSAGTAAAKLADVTPSIQDLTSQERQGRDLYERDCRLCHAGDGSGNNWIGQFLQPHASDLRIWLARSDGADDATLRAGIASGRPGSSMPDFATVLNEAEMDAILAYMRRAFGSTGETADE